MNLAARVSKYSFSWGVLALSSVGALLHTTSVQAATFDLDFNWTNIVVEGNTDNAVQALSANQLDSKEGQYIDGTKFSTKEGNIGDIWSDYGISIEIGAGSKSSTLGLFNSNCVARNGVSESGFTSTCAKNSKLGDNDLATGKGSYGTVSYDTIAQGNLLIFEENKGNAFADDTSKGGTFIFKVDDSKDWFVEEIGIVDDAKGSITYTYRDNSSSTETFDIKGENELQFFNAAQEKEIQQIAVSLDGSGAISGLRFRDAVVAGTEIPEPATALSFVALGAIFVRTKRSSKAVLSS